MPFLLQIPTKDDCYEAKLTILNVEGGDSKTYSLVIENEKGQESYSVALEVRGAYMYFILFNKQK